jgi:hypothetical protein
VIEYKRRVGAHHDSSKTQEFRVHEERPGFDGGFERIPALGCGRNEQVLTAFKKSSKERFEEETGSSTEGNEGNEEKVWQGLV